MNYFLKIIKMEGYFFFLNCFQNNLSPFDTHIIIFVKSFCYTSIHRKRVLEEDVIF